MEGYQPILLHIQQHHNIEMSWYEVHKKQEIVSSYQRLLVLSCDLWVTIRLGVTN